MILRRELRAGNGGFQGAMSAFGGVAGIEIRGRYVYF